MSHRDAQAASITRQARAAAKGQTGIFDTLAREHGLVSALMSQLLRADIDTRIELYPKIRAEIISHAHAEAETFYPTLLKHPETRGRARTSIDEHQGIEDLIDRLDWLDIASPEWLSVFEKMREAFRHHLKQDEQELFPRARKIMDRAEARHLERRFEQEKRRLLSAIHPAAQ